VATVQQAATFRQSAKVPAGTSQYKPRPTNPFQVAHWSQFIYPGDRKKKARALGRQKYLAALWHIGPTMTAEQCARLTHTPVDTVKDWREWTLHHPQGEDFALAVNYGEIPNRRRRASGRFDGDRVYKTCHPERLQPIAKGSRYTRRRESHPSVSRESHPLDSKDLNSNAKYKNKHVEQDTSDAQNRASHGGGPETIPETKTIPSDYFFQAFANDQGGEDIADGVLGWIAYRKMHGSAANEPVKNPWAYFRAGIKNFLEMEQGKQDALIGRHSFCHLMNIPHAEANIWRNNKRDVLRDRLERLDYDIARLDEFIPAKIGTVPRWFAEGKEATLARLKRERTKLRSQLRQI
jgi:hypothetical protein